uniref:Uncharacterized protein n=1 Tax=Opuntia streptacantha TaxID=393608 RepID=A0A7C9D642_OPUST
MFQYMFYKSVLNYKFISNLIKTTNVTNLKYNTFSVFHTPHPTELWLNSSSSRPPALSLSHTHTRTPGNTLTHPPLMVWLPGLDGDGKPLELQNSNTGSGGETRQGWWCSVGRPQLGARKVLFTTHSYTSDSYPVSRYFSLHLP